MSERKTSDGRTLTAPQVAALEAIEGRMKWASLHWGVEGVDPDAWPHLASVAADAALTAQPAISAEQLNLAAGYLSATIAQYQHVMNVRGALRRALAEAGLTVAGESDE